MKHPMHASLIAVAVALALPGAIFAQQQSSQPPSQTSQQQQSQKGQSASQGESKPAQSARGGGQQQVNLSQIRATQLKNLKVVDGQGKDIGEISEVVVDLQSGRIHAAVVEFGGFMGMGEKQFAFAPTQLKAGKQRNQVVLNVDKQKLESAEGFAKNQWPAMGDEYWGRVGGKSSAGGSQAQKGQTSGQQQPSQQAKQQKAGGQMQLVRSSELMGKDVQDKSGEDIADIRDLVLDVPAGRVRNVVLDVQDGGQAMVQPKALKGATGDKYMVSMSREQLRSQAKQRSGDASAGQSNRQLHQGEGGVLGPTRARQDPVGGADTGVGRTVPEAAPRDRGTSR